MIGIQLVDELYFIPHMKKAMDKISTVRYQEDLTEDIAFTKLILLSLKLAENAQQS